MHPGRRHEDRWTMSEGIGGVRIEDGLSIVHGIPIAEESGLGPLTLAGFVQEVARRYGPCEAAMIDLDGTRISWTYDELLMRSTEIAKALIAAGVGKGTRVGFIVTNRPEFLSCLFGTALAGAVATPISTFYTAPEMEEVLRAAGVSVLIFERRVLRKDFAELLVGLEPQIASAAPGEVASTRFPFLRHLAMIDGEEGIGAVEGWSTFLARGREVDDALVEATAAASLPADPGILLFSSGSTGKAKGVLSANRGVCLQLWRWAKWYNFAPDVPPRTWGANGFFWSGNLTQQIGGTLSAGGTLILQRWFDQEQALALMEAERATMAIAWPHQWPQLEAAPNYRSVDLSALRYVDMKMPIARHPTVRSTWRENGSAYGNTETFTLITVFPSGTPDEIAEGTHGIPTAGSTIKIVEPFTGATMPLGERGEIAVKGPTLMLGYLGTPLSDTLDEDGFLRTADGGFIDDQGRLHWEGRLNDIIKTGGANVSPLEIDAVIRDCPGVKVTQTVGVPDELLGEMVVGCIVRHEGADIDPAAITAFARERLASYKVPRRILFFAEDELETTGSSKIKTAELRKLAVARLAAS
jgi:fatty-acyl-CoA synthase